MPIRLTRIAALAIIVSSCGGGSDGSTNPPTQSGVASVTLSVTSATLVPGQTASITATAKDAQGATVSTSIAWSSSAVSIATVASDGTVSGVAAGSATITASAGGKSATASVTVLDGAVIGAAGGTMSRPDGALSVVIPAGALTDARAISILGTSGAPTDANRITGTAFDLGPAGTAFSKPVTVKIKYALSALPANTPQSRLALRHNVNGAWETVPGFTIDSTNHVVSGNVSSFSWFELAFLSIETVTLTVNLQGVSAEILRTGEVWVYAGAMSRANATRQNSIGNCLFQDATTTTCKFSLFRNSSVTLMAVNLTNAEVTNYLSSASHDFPVAASDTIGRTGGSEFKGFVAPGQTSCTTAADLCTMDLSSDQTVTANFGLQHLVVVAMVGVGSYRVEVTQAPPRLNVPAEGANPQIGQPYIKGFIIAPGSKIIATARYVTGTTVKYTMLPASDGIKNFIGWSTGYCANLSQQSDVCTITFLPTDNAQVLVYPKFRYYKCVTGGFSDAKNSLCQEQVDP